MDAKRYHIVALLLCALAPAVAAASTPPRAELQKAWDACTAVAANSGHGRLSTDATDWPRGFKGCAVVVSDMDAREAAEAKHAWAQWVAKHAADQELIRKVAGEMVCTREVRAATRKVEAAQRAFLGALQENAPAWRISELYLAEREAYDTWASDSASALGAGAPVQETPLLSTFNWRQFKRQCATATKRAAHGTP
ncbi:MAG: hypothetical protein M0Z84_09615 [Gammaproteobacteria bacterium]|nr:hypothetical protein [Gammaproteobacteria bacterium]